MKHTHAQGLKHGWVDKHTDERYSVTDPGVRHNPGVRHVNAEPSQCKASFPDSTKLGGADGSSSGAAMTLGLPTAVPGHRAGSRGHHHWLLLLLPGSQELQDHGVFQEHGSPGEGCPGRGRVGGSHAR